MIFDGLLMLASKSSCRFGDGLAQTAIWKYWLPDFWASGHVSCTDKDDDKDDDKNDDKDDDKDDINNLFYHGLSPVQVRHLLCPPHCGSLRGHGEEGGRGCQAQQLCEH